MKSAIYNENNLLFILALQNKSLSLYQQKGNKTKHYAKN